MEALVLAMVAKSADVATGSEKGLIGCKPLAKSFGVRADSLPIPSRRSKPAINGSGTTPAVSPVFPEVDGEKHEPEGLVYLPLCSEECRAFVRVEQIARGV